MEKPRVSKERHSTITLGMGSLITSRQDGDLYVVYDVGRIAAKGPPIKACEILDEDQGILSFSGSMYPHDIHSVLDHVWPENRIVEAFIKSYRLTDKQMTEVMSAIENRGPRLFDANS